MATSERVVKEVFALRDIRKMVHGNAREQWLTRVTVFIAGRKATEKEIAMLRATRGNV